ncbi:DUF4352 domain-containing protein [Cytobacillus depressus]|uniref:DUF4352 domain-containing protein n=1 Tax=Cytobacillus depressus TaxID=1602942 RepID=A0A6L3UYW9_9BACI|nr:DUF4352 domain-containing protein [Cytobacillus depressus]KAB2328491.1 DUF4352 domain-containing protein [Cytobacillus depressus]
MKKLFSLFLLIALAGCSASNTTVSQDVEKITEKSALEVNKDVYVPSPHITDDLNFVNVGETISDSKGELTLKEYKKVNMDIQVGPANLTIKDIKVMHFVPDFGMIDFFHDYTHDEEFDFVKVGVEVKNTSTDEIKFNPIAYLKMNSGEHKTWEDDIYLEELLGKMEPNEVKKGNLGFILEDTDEITWVELLTSDVVNKKDESIEKAKNIKLDF